VSTVTVKLTTGDVSLVVHLPAGAGPFPIVFLSAGFGQVAAGYAPYAERLASHGVVVLSRDDPGLGGSSPALAAQLAELLSTWLPAEVAKPSGLLAAKIDLSHLGLMGHSRGGQVSLLAATGALLGKVSALFALDPVDTSTGGAQARTALPGIGIPTVFFGETLDGTPKFFIGPGCANAADNYQVLYAAAPSPSLLLTALGADHFDFVLASKAVGAGICNSGSADGEEVLELAVTLSTGFFARELAGVSSVGPLLDGAGAAAAIADGRLTRVAK